MQDISLYKTSVFYIEFFKVFWYIKFQHISLSSG